MTTKRRVIQSQRLEIQYPIQVKRMTDKEIRDYHLKRLYDLSLKTLGDIPQLEELTEEQEEWFERRMKGTKRSWETWDA